MNYYKKLEFTVYHESTNKNESKFYFTKISKI